MICASEWSLRSVFGVAGGGAGDGSRVRGGMMCVFSSVCYVMCR
jgi:hypothetical protein